MITLAAEVQTSFVPGWAVGVPLLICAALLLWVAFGDHGDQP